MGRMMVYTQELNPEGIFFKHSSICMKVYIQMIYTNYDQMSYDQVEPGCTRSVCCWKDQGYLHQLVPNQRVSRLLKIKVLALMVRSSWSEHQFTDRENVIVDLHVGFVIRADLLDPDVILGVDERLSGCVCLSDGHDTCDVLEVTVIVNFHLPGFKCY